MPIRNKTFIGGYDVSDDVISINTEHVSSQSEAVEPSTCKVVLNNHDLIYGKAIVSGAFIPGHTRIQSIVVITRNIVHGNSLSVASQAYILFTGVVNDAAYTNETATIDCICESGFGAGSSLDRSWAADTFFSEKVADWQMDEENQTGAKLLIRDRTTSPSPKKSQFNASKLSFNEALRAISTGASKDYYFSTDEELQPMIILADDKTYYSEVNLDPFVLEPGDATTLVGYANEVTVIPENITDQIVQANIPDPQKEVIKGWASDPAGIETYGRIVAPIVYDPGIYSQEDANLRAEALIDWYNTFIDRGINVTVCSMIPMVRQIVVFNVPDVRNGGFIKVKAGVNKKSVEYSMNGVITRLECRLLARNLEESEGSEPEFETILTEVPKQYQEYFTDAIIYGPLGLLSTTKNVLFMVNKSGNVYFIDANIADPANVANAQLLVKNSPQPIKDMFASIEDALLDKAMNRWGSEFRQ